LSETILEHPCFQVSGDFITDQARAFVLEEQWRRGLDLLRRGLSEMDYESAISILAGRKRLDGINHLDLVDEDPVEAELFAGELRYRYAGLYQVGHDFFKPYAYVDNWGPDDCRERVPNRFHNRLVTREAYVVRFDPLVRSVYYMNDQVNDRAEVLEVPVKDGFNKRAVVLFAQVDDPPFWIEFAKTPQEALEAFLANGGCLSHRGYHTIPEGPCAARTEAQRLETGRRIVEQLDTILRDPDFPRPDPRVVRGLGLDPEVFEPPPKPEPPEANQDPTAGKLGWVLRDGRFERCQYFGHKDLAARLLEEQGVEVSDPDRQGMEAGWVKVVWSELLGEYEVYSPSRTTKAQQETMLNWCLANGLTPSDFAMFKES
jgi:hypothetical protein